MIYAKRLDIVDAIAGSFAPLTILDIGCGACGVADIFKSHGHDVYLTDITPERVPKEWMPRFVKMSAVDVPLDGMEAVIMAGLLYHLSTESQAAVCKRMTGRLVFLDTHYVRTPGPGEPRKKTASSEPHPVIPSIEFIRGELFPNHFLMQTAEHVDGRSWFVCVPKTVTTRKMTWGH